MKLKSNDSNNDCNNSDQKRIEKLEIMRNITRL